MDTHEKRVVRWKRHLVSSSVVWSEELARALRQRNLLSEVVQPQIEAEGTNFGRVSRFLDMLLRGASCFGVDEQPYVFTSLCDVIENEGCQPWVAEELRMELRTERGDLTVEEYIRKEAAQIVHRYYGGTKRLSEIEKRRLETIIAVRTQCTKDVWKRNLDTAWHQLEEQRASLRTLDEEVASAVRVLQEAVRDQRNAASESGSARPSGKTKAFLAEEAAARNWSAIKASVESASKESFFPIIGKGSRIGSGDSSGTWSIAGEEPSHRGSPSSRLVMMLTEKMKHASVANMLQMAPKTIAAALVEAADEVRRLTEMWSAERERLRGERSRALAAIGVRESTGSRLRLDGELQSVVQRLNDDLSIAKERAVDAEEHARALEDRVRSVRMDVDEELKSKDRTIGLLTANLERAEREMMASQGEVREMRKQMQLVKSELSRHSIRSRYLEKSRHLGYMLDGYGIPELDDAVPAVPRRVITKKIDTGRGSTKNQSTNGYRGAAQSRDSPRVNGGTPAV